MMRIVLVIFSQEWEGKGTRSNMLSDHSCHKCANNTSSNKCETTTTTTTMCAMLTDGQVLEAICDAGSSNILIVKQNRKNLKSPTHICRMCGYGDFSSQRVRRHLMLKHHAVMAKILDHGSASPIHMPMIHAVHSLNTHSVHNVLLSAHNEKSSILADRLSFNRSHLDSEPESPLSVASHKVCGDDLPEDLSVHSDGSSVCHSDNDENVQVVPQFKPQTQSATYKASENKRSVIVRTPKKATKRFASQNSSGPASSQSILKRRLLGLGDEPLVDDLEASEASLNSSELNVKMVYSNQKFVIDSSESFWLKGYKLPPRYELAPTA
ncbi:hypothetical protein BIW11_08252 [Tropilaelaps mercedesae]|uniref:Uncharacterized protein n=1 Tax=Tropilaelaps mercedesae TaxID=418985 RepID=A0A1V9XQR7_9ACAR|nr:hypothetical protein BIW11_08252 [Tropilaelaps mercedesae]